jgi:hypothetical protein
MLASLLHMSLALASENLDISDADKIYINPTDVVVMENGFHISINDSYVVVYHLFADANGIFVIPPGSAKVQGWVCPQCGVQTCGFWCHKCGYPF